MHLTETAFTLKAISNPINMSHPTSQIPAVNISWLSCGLAAGILCSNGQSVGMIQVAMSEGQRNVFLPPTAQASFRLVLLLLLPRPSEQSGPDPYSSFVDGPLLLGPLLVAPPRLSYFNPGIRGGTRYTSTL